MRGVIDTTLREGAQAPGVYMSLETKSHIVGQLHRFGVEEIEMGWIGDDDIETLVTEARINGISTSLAVWCRCLIKDVVRAIEIEPDVISISVPASDLHIERRLGRDRSWVLKQLTSVVKLAKAEGSIAISVGLEDATRADKEFLKALLLTAVAAGANRVRLSDTVGIATPSLISNMVADAARLVEPLCSIGIHTHNDFGMATANAISALEAGASWVDASVLGLGERAGIAKLEEITGYLSLIEPRNLGRYRMAELSSLCNTVAAAVGVTIQTSHPIIGERLFECESGLHVDGITKNPKTYEPYSPESVNLTRRFSLGKKSGRAAVVGKMHEMGIDASQFDILTIITQIRQKSKAEGRPLTDEEVINILSVKGA